MRVVRRYFGFLLGFGFAMACASFSNLQGSIYLFFIIAIVSGFTFGIVLNSVKPD